MTKDEARRIAANQAAGEGAEGRSTILFESRCVLISKCALLLSSTWEQIVLRYITDMMSVRRLWLRDRLSSCLDKGDCHVFDLSALRRTRFRATLADVTKHAAAADDEQRFRVACGSDASLPGIKPVRLGTPARGGPFRGRVARSIHFLGGSQSGRQTRSEPILATSIRSAHARTSRLTSPVPLSRSRRKSCSAGNFRREAALITGLAWRTN